MVKKALKKLYELIPFKKQLFSFIRLFHPPMSLYKHLHFKGVFRAKAGAGSFLIRHYGYQVENRLFWSGLTGGWEKISMGLWMELCKRSVYIVDVGANTGVYSLVAKTINPNSRVFAFEPVTRVFNKLKYNVQLNGFDIVCLEAAASNQDGEAKIYDSPVEHVYSVTVNKNMNPALCTIETVIKTKTLSTFIEEEKLPRIDLMKIDVETHEPEVLEGMGKYLSACKPTLLIEILDNEVGQRVETLLQGMNYLYFNIDEVNPPKQVSSIRKSGHFNYLLCQPEVARALKLTR